MGLNFYTAICINMFLNEQYATASICELRLLKFKNLITVAFERYP